MHTQMTGQVRSRPGSTATTMIVFAGLALTLSACPAPEDDEDAGTTVDASTSADASQGYDAGLGGTWLSNAPPADPPTLLAPDPGEEGHRAAARLTPPSYPFEVSQLRYMVGDGPAGNVECSGTLSHLVEIYVDSAAAPPESPNPAFSVTIPTGTPEMIGHIGRTILQEVSPPVRLEQDEHLFVAVQLCGTHPDVLCLQVNSGDPYDSDRNYWSSAATAPYGWTELDSFGLTGDIMIDAYGEPAP